MKAVYCVYCYDLESSIMVEMFSSEKKAKNFVAEKLSWKTEFKKKFSHEFPSEYHDLALDEKDWIRDNDIDWTVDYFYKKREVK